MINSIEKEGINKCSGCTTCKIACPFNAIEIELDKDGFLVPVVNKEKCTNCGICTKSCYKYYNLEKDNQKNIKDTSIYGMWNKDDKVREESSSGGICTEILKWGLNNGYEVIGCKYNSNTNKAEHICIDDLDDLDDIRGSKYLQSDFSSIINKIDFNKKYIVVGTPCQIYGMKKIVKNRNKEDNFIFIDFFCHGVPSYNLWNKYIKTVVKNNIEKINFRKKNPDWHNFSININDGKYEKSIKDDIFLKAFLSNLCLNDSCYNCKLRFNKVYSDIRLGDFWGKDYQSNKDGVSIVLSSSGKGNMILNDIKSLVVSEKKEVRNLVNSQYHGESIFKHINSEEFKKDLLENTSLEIDLSKALKRSIKSKIQGRIKIYLKRIFK